MENQNNSVITYLSEEIVTEILARLPLRSISRFKSVCRIWKSTLESLYFRRLFVSMHRNNSKSWLRVNDDEPFMIDLHRCQTWGLPNSLGYYFQNIVTNDNITYMDSSNGLVLIDGYNGNFYVGNPILQQWVVIPNLCSWMAHLVTRVDEDGVVLSFKVVMVDGLADIFYLSVYSSETGIWTRKELHCPHDFVYMHHCMTLHEMLYICDANYDVIIAHDLYGASNVCRIIPLPDHDYSQLFKRSLTTSTEFVIYMKTLDNNDLKVWRLLNNDDDSAWELLWKTDLSFIPSEDNFISYRPLTMNPCDLNIVYLWFLNGHYLVSCYLETQTYNIFIDQLKEGDLQNCFVNHSVCEKHIDGLCVLYLQGRCKFRNNNFQYVSPRWMGSIPCPPRAKILYTTSLPSCITIQSEEEK